MVNQLIFDQDLSKPVQFRQLHGSLFEADNNGLQVGVRVFKNGVAENLSGVVRCSIVCSDETIIVVNGEISGNVATVYIPQSSLMPGTIKILLKIVDGSTTTTMLALSGVVHGMNGSLIYVLRQQEIVYTPNRQIKYDNRKFMDVSDTTATVDDVRAGKTFYDSSGNKVVGVGDYAVTFGDNVTVFSLGNDDYRFDFA